MIRFFSSAHPFNILLLFFLGLIIRIPFFIAPIEVQVSLSTGELYYFLHNSLFINLKSYPILLPSIAYVIIFIQALSINGFINNQKLFSSPHMLFILSYLIFTAVMPEWNTLSPQLISSVVLTIVIQKFIIANQKIHIANDLFLTSTLSGLAGLIYKPAVVFLVLIFLGIIIFRSFRLADWIIVILGFLFPYYLAFSYLFISDHWNLAKSVFPVLGLQKPVFFQQSEDVVIFVLIAVPLMIGFFHARRNAVRMVVLPRKAWLFISAALLISLGSYFTGIQYVFDALFLIMLPVCFFITAFLYYPTVKFFPSLYIWLILGFLAVNHFL